MKTATVLLITSLALAGCESNFAMPAMDASLARHGLVTPEQARQLEAKLTDKDIADMLDANVKAKVPTYLAVARLNDEAGVRPDGYHDRGRGRSLALGTISGADLDGWQKVIANERQIKGLRVISPAILATNDLTLPGLRNAAAHMGCELLLVYVQADGQVDNTTDAAALYWTLVGLWTVPGNVYERKTVMQSAVLDCRTGMILATSAGECSMKESYPAAFEKTAHAKLDAQVPGKALEDLQKNSAPAFAQVVATAAHKATTTRQAGQD